MNKFIDAEKLKESIDEKWKKLADKNVKAGGGKWDAEISTYLSVLRLIDSLQQEQPEVDLEEEIRRTYHDGSVGDTSDMDHNDYENIAHHFYGLRNRALEEAARHVYESWMGGTMNDVRRDMVELGRVINARKEEYVYHFDNGKIYNCMKCRHVGITPGCIFHKDYVPSENNYPCDVNGDPIKSAIKRD